ncbi:phage major capsid protein [Pectinatus haikarae]|uniref:HK97 family phage major capsid protein n=1 Tax=Pectinatus haikarae TaxID=349096 RepID=A0ABT9YAE2_9FIRM|nr:phage major capsid protein [Pectinatus haikarae]MDQ0204074.1 HK97 family phage major capsid protein [Pectinatus haikarae]
MKKSDEIKNQITQVRAEIETLQSAEKFDDAAAKAKELTDLVREYNTVKAMEDSDFSNFTQGMTPINTIADKNDKKLINRTFNKLVFGQVFNRTLTDEEKSVVDKIVNAAGTPGQVGATPAKGGYLIPTEQFAQLLEFRRSYTALKSFCTIRAAGSRNGQQPTIGEEDGTLTNFEELNEIAQSDLDFAQIKYAVKDYGDIIPIANQLLEDVDIDLMSVIGQRFARKAINTENAQILAIINALTATVPTTGYKSIQTALNKTLDPAISAGATIFTNQTGYDYLDQLTDSNKRPLLTASLADPTQYLFKGRRIVMLKDTLLANDTTTEAGKTLAPFVVGSMSDLIHFFDRVGIEIAVSTEAGFTKNATFVRAIERFDVQEVDSAAMTYLKLDVGA